MKMAEYLTVYRGAHLAILMVGSCQVVGRLDKGPRNHLVESQLCQQGHGHGQNALTSSSDAIPEP
jgi:hypothetical protein